MILLSSTSSTICILHMSSYDDWSLVLPEITTRLFGLCREVSNLLPFIMFIFLLRKFMSPFDSIAMQLTLSSKGALKPGIVFIFEV